MRTPDSWSLGVLIGLPLACLIVLGLLLAFVVMLWGRLDIEEEEYHFEYSMGALISGVALLTTLGITLSGLYPYREDFHRYYKVSGNVEQVAHRQISDGNTMSERYVLVIGGEPYGVDDTRASLVHEGDHVTLMCKKEWVYNSESGWACNWGGK